MTRAIGQGRKTYPNYPELRTLETVESYNKMLLEECRRRDNWPMTVSERFTLRSITDRLLLNKLDEIKQ